jgi:hypothetical protein
MEDLDSEPDADTVSSRAEGRPPEESSSDDPEAQAKVILEESEGRLADGARKSTEGASPSTPGSPA